MKCPACAFENPPAFKFCGECGARLAAAATPAPSRPPDEIHEGERRPVTILFADVSGFTALSEKLDPEVLFNLMNRCFQLQGAVITRHQGTVDKFIGDCVMALFGAPVARVDDPERAVRAALEMQRELDRFAGEFREREAPDLRMRIGLNSGVVVAGPMGSDERRAYTVMGDAVNLASRLESAAPPGGILVSESVYRRARRQFVFQACEPIRVKGKEQPVRVYEVIEEKEEGGQYGRGLTPFVGRAAEIAVLASAMDAASAGGGGLVTVAGEAGSGKSRLLEELLPLAAEREMTLVRARAQSAERGVSYRVVRTLLEALAGLGAAEDEAAIRARLRETLVEIQPALLDWLPFLADVFGFPRLSGTDAATAKRMTQQAVRRIFRALAERRGVVIALDDAQWMDPLSIETLGLLARETSGARLLIIAAHRPGFSPPWTSEVPHASAITLRGLAPADAEAMARAILGAGEVTADVSELLLMRSGGNPLFAEELAEALIESGALGEEDGRWRFRREIEEADLPRTLEAAVTARIDRLSPDHKRPLQVAAAIGLRFPVDLFAHAAECTADVRDVLGVLERSDFILESSPPPSWHYAFPQAVTRQVSYDMMLADRRARVHKQVAEALETLHGQAAADWCEALAHHHALSPEPILAVPHLVRAGEKAERLYAVTEARAYYTRALEIALPARVEGAGALDAAVSHAHEGLGNLAALTGDYPEALSRYSTVVASLQAHARRHTSARETEAGPPGAEIRLRIAALRRRIGNVQGRSGEYLAAVNTLKEVLAALESEPGSAAGRESALTMSELAAISNRTGNFADAAAEAGRALATAEQFRSGRAIADAALVLGIAHQNLGNMDKAEASYRRSLSIREELGDLVGVASALNNLGTVAADSGRLNDADEFYRRSFEIRERMAHAEGMSAALVNRGNIAFDLGRYEEGRTHFERALDITTRIGDGYTATLCRLSLARTRLAAGDVGAASREIGTALADAERLGLHGLSCLGLAVRALVRLQEGDAGSALTDAENAMGAAAAIASRFHQAFALRVAGAAGSAQGDGAIAMERLARSLALFEEMDTELDVARTLVEMRRAAPGDPEAAAWHERARDIFARLGAAGDLAVLKDSPAPADG